MGTVATILSVLLALAFVAVGVPKVTGGRPQADAFDRFGIAPGLRLLIGGVALVAALFLLIGIGVHALGVIAAILVIVVTVGALSTHRRLGDPAPRFAPPLVLLVLALIVGIVRL